MKNEKKLPMRKLEELSGFSRTMISFYIKEGLLPSPSKSAKNMAYYDESYIQKLNLIQQLKDAGLSLAEIKTVVTDNEKAININPLLHSMKSINHLLALGVDNKPITIKELIDSGIDDDMTKQLIQLSILHPLNDEHTLFPSESITIFKLAQYFFNLGIPYNVSKDILREIRKMIEIEIRAFRKYTKSEMKFSSEEQQALMVTESIENINTLLPLLHLQMIKSEIHSNR